jgi:hypothetical protein
MIGDGHGTRAARRLARLYLALKLLGLAAVAAACLAVLQGWPGTPLKRNLPPSDLPWQGYGIRKLTVGPDGAWHILRAGYVDRQRRLEVSPGGALTAFHDDNLASREVDASGGFDVVERTTDLGSVISVKPSRAYYKWLKDLRRGGDKQLLNPLPDPASDAGARPGTRAVLQEWMPEVEHPGQPTHVDLPAPPDTGVAVWLNPHNKLAFFSLLPGHWYFSDVADCAAFKDDKLWLTMDRQRNLYRLRIDEPGGAPPEITLEAGVPLDLPGLATHAGRLGLDPRRGQLFLVRPDGQRYWFDPQTLMPTGSDALPGDWVPEYAEFDLRAGGYNAYMGTPLSRAQYDALMQGTMVVFLASLLGLAMLWRPQWKSTLAPTTADSGSSASSENT